MWVQGGRSCHLFLSPETTLPKVSGNGESNMIQVFTLLTANIVWYNSMKDIEWKTYLLLIIVFVKNVVNVNQCFKLSITDQSLDLVHIYFWNRLVTLPLLEQINHNYLKWLSLSLVITNLKSVCLTRNHFTRTWRSLLWVLPPLVYFIGSFAGWEKQINSLLFSWRTTAWFTSFSKSTKCISKLHNLYLSEVLDPHSLRGDGLPRWRPFRSNSLGFASDRCRCIPLS